MFAQTFGLRTAGETKFVSRAGVIERDVRKTHRTIVDRARARGRLRGNRKQGSGDTVVSTDLPPIVSPSGRSNGAEIDREKAGGGGRSEREGRLLGEREAG